MQLYAGLDLHSTNTYIGIMDKEFKRVFSKRVSNKLPLILKTLAPFISSAPIWAGGGTITGCISGPWVIMYRRLGMMKRACVITSRNRRKKTHGWISSSYSMMNDHRQLVR